MPFIFDDTFVAILEADIDANVVPALMGPPGIGKSSVALAIAKSLGTKCFVLAVNEIGDRADLTAGRLLPELDDNGEPTGNFGQQFYPHKTIMDAISYAEAHPNKPVLLMLDEINRTTPDITSSALSLPTRRAIGSKDLPKNLKLIIAGNLKGNVVALDSASITRFSIYHVAADAEVFLSYMTRRNQTNPIKLNRFIEKALREDNKLVFQEARPEAYASGNGDDEDSPEVSMADLVDAGDEMLQFTTPRTLEYLNDWLETYEKRVPDGFRELMGTTIEQEAREISALQAIIESKIGNTPTADKIIALIATELANTNNVTAPSTSMVVPRPLSYHEIENATSIDELTEAIEKLDEEQRQLSILYALHQSVDNETKIQHLAEGIGQMLPETNTIFVEMLRNNAIDAGNLTALKAVTSSQFLEGNAAMLLSVFSLG